MACTVTKERTALREEIIMIISFCGHSLFRGTQEHEKRILDFLEEKVGNNPAEMFLGGYGDFDNFALSCCKKFKKTHPNVSLVFVTPYITLEYQENHLEYIKDYYDEIIYPEIEDKPLKFAISYRNKYMMEAADYVVAYVRHNSGGAYASYKHAKRRGKEIFNLYDNFAY